MDAWKVLLQDGVKTEVIVWVEDCRGCLNMGER